MGKPKLINTSHGAGHLNESRHWNIKWQDNFIYMYVFTQPRYLTVSLTHTLNQIRGFLPWKCV